LPIQRPTWLPSYIPELQGLRGLAVLSVVFYHCHPRLVGTWVHYASLWGWAGVNLFFVLSGFLITSILLEARSKPNYFRNFYGRRALRIWPVYFLVLIVVYLNAPWFIGPTITQAIKTAPWMAYIFFVQNLFHLALPPAIGPTWSLAIEEQYYFLWAPIVRFLRNPGALAGVLAAALIASPVFRLANMHWMTLTHTLIHLDGIALGSLLALALYRFHLPRRVFLWTGLSAAVLGFLLTATIAGGTSLLDSALALAFAGIVLACLAGTGAHNPFAWVLRRGPLAWYGKISYGLYMTHILVFVYFGNFDARLDDKYHISIAGNLLIVALRLIASTIVATILWYGFETQILKLKRYFKTA
jgi:peptidoglycan/LPS O-acetylase OafA/YrhL